MDKRIAVALGTLILIGAFAGYSIYSDKDAQVVIVERNGLVNESAFGATTDIAAVCPEGKSALRGTCTSRSIFMQVVGNGQLTTSNAIQDYTDSWLCTFKITDKTDYVNHPYTVTVTCT